jgi:membrane dipeptidase
MQADLHLDTPTQLHRRKVGLDATGLEAGLAQLRAGGTNLAVMALWPPRTTDGEAHVDALLTRMEAEDARLDDVVLVRSPAEARAAAAAGRVGIVYALEGGHGIDRSGIIGLERLHARGLALLGLTWTFDTRWAGSSGGGGTGLTAEGRALVDAANRLGVLLDVSHASRATTLEVCARSHAPVVASHSDTHALTPHPRNLHDDEIRAIAATGGVIGVNLHRPFLGGTGDLARAADHATHLKRIGGPGVVALGTDFDGLIVPPRDLRDAGGLGALWPLLAARGWTASEVEGLRGANFLRAWEAARNAASSTATTRSSRVPG